MLEIWKNNIVKPFELPSCFGRLVKVIIPMYIRERGPLSGDRGYFYSVFN